MTRQQIPSTHQRPSDPVFSAQSNDPLVFQSSPIHGTGAFAKHGIKKGTTVIEYRGEPISKSESIRRCEASNPYIFSISDKQDLDGSVEWNPARFLNHSCEPNCEALVIQERVWIVSIRDIVEGEELTFNYGFDLEDYRHYPCRCGATGCAGYIVAEEFFDHVRKQPQ